MFEFKKINKSAFTLIEMIIVLIVIGILLMATIGLSGSQIQKIKNKTVKESILSEWQSRYSRNLGSSSFAGGIMYDHMDITVTSGNNVIYINYIKKDGTSGVQNTFSDRFTIENIITNYSSGVTDLDTTGSITLQYRPYQLPCEWGDSDGTGNLVLMVDINDNSASYCFQISRKNCRLVEMSESACDKIRHNPSL